MGASTEAIGTTRAQNHPPRRVLVYLNMFPINHPDVLISNTMDRFNQEGNLKDDGFSLGLFFRIPRPRPTAAADCIFAWPFEGINEFTRDCPSCTYTMGKILGPGLEHLILTA